MCSGDRSKQCKAEGTCLFEELGDINKSAVLKR